MEDNISMSPNEWWQNSLAGLSIESRCGYIEFRQRLILNPIETLSILKFDDDIKNYMIDEFRIISTAMQARGNDISGAACMQDLKAINAEEFDKCCSSLAASRQMEWLNTRFGNAMQVLGYGIPLLQDADDIERIIIKNACLLYFANHIQTSAVAPGKLTKQEIADLRTYLKEASTEDFKDILKEQGEIYNELHPLIYTDKILRPMSRLSQKVHEFETDERGEIRGGVGLYKEKQLQAKIYIESKELTKVDKLTQGIATAVGQILFDNRGCSVVECTPAQIWRKYLALKPDDPVSEQAQQLVADILDKCRVTNVKIDCTEQLNFLKKHKREFNYEAAGQISTNLKRMLLDPDAEIQQFFIEGTLIHSTSTTGKYIYKGSEIKEKVYRFSEIPPIFLHSALINQIATFPNYIINPPKVKKGEKLYVSSPVHKTRDTMPILDAMLIQLNALRNDKTKENKNPCLKISYEKLAANAGSDVSTRQRMRAFQTNVKKALKQFVAVNQLGYAEEYRTGRQIKGVTMWLSHAPKDEERDPSMWNTEKE